MNKQAITMLCRASRKAQKITLEELMIKSGVSVSGLSRFERGSFNRDIMIKYMDIVLLPSERDTLKHLMEDY